MYVIENCLKIIGSDDQIREVRDYIKEDCKEGEEGVDIDFEKIIPIPEEIYYVSICSPGGLVYCLLFGEHYGDNWDKEGIILEEGFDPQNEELKRLKKDNPIKYLQFRFKNLSNSKKREGIEMALKYHSNFEKYGCYDSYGWRMKNWGTLLNVFHQGLTKDNDIVFLTRDYSALQMIVKLSEIFPQVIFELETTDPQSFCQDEKYCYSISNGVYNYYEVDASGEKVLDYSTYYEKINRLIQKYRCQPEVNPNSTC